MHFCSGKPLQNLSGVDRMSFRRINGKTHYLWRAVDYEGEVLETYVTKTRIGRR